MYILRQTTARLTQLKFMPPAFGCYFSEHTSSSNNKEQQDEQHNNENHQQKQNKNTQNHLMLRGSFEGIADKNRKTYMDMVQIFESRDIHRRNHVEFIYAAMKSMESFGVHRDVEVYKALMNVMPKEKFIPRNMFQVDFMHYPKQQQCIIDLLEQMEDNGETHLYYILSHTIML